MILFKRRNREKLNQQKKYAFTSNNTVYPSPINAPPHDIRLDRNVLHDDYFVQFLEKENIEVQRIDFPQRKKLDPEALLIGQTIIDRFI